MSGLAHAPRRTVLATFVLATFVLAMVVLATRASAAPPDPTAADAGGTITVLAFNIRYDEPRDGADRWSARRDLVLEVLRREEPDFIALQEVLPSQQAWILAALAERGPAYGVIARSRETDPAEGEANPLLHREDRWRRLEGGVFWLSETPEVPGSRSWSSACPRIATWGRFASRSEESRRILVVNTHLDHASADARAGAAARLAGFIRSARSDRPGEPVILLGDFNMTPDDPAMQPLLDSVGGAGLRDVAPEDPRGGGTFHGFRGRPDGRRIDLLLASREFAAASAEIDRTSREGRFPSDHFPLRATLRLAAPSREDRP